MSTKASGFKNMERALRARGVYKPYVSMDMERLYIESYPLTAIITSGFDPEQGPTQNVKITDCTLPRIGQDATITTLRLFIGQDVCQHVGQALMDFHGPAHARATEQDRAAARKNNSENKSAVCLTITT